MNIQNIKNYKLIREKHTDFFINPAEFCIKQKLYNEEQAKYRTSNYKSA